MLIMLIVCSVDVAISFFVFFVLDIVGLSGLIMPAITGGDDPL